MKPHGSCGASGAHALVLILLISVLTASVLNPSIVISAYAEDVTWSRVFDGYAGYAISPTTDGGYIAGGVPYLLKLDENGNLEWAKEIEVTTPQSLIHTEDGGYFVTGNARIDPSFKQQVIAKLDSSGNVEWMKARPPGGFLVAVDQADDGGYILAGHAFPEWPGGPADVWVVKLDSDGNLEWDKIYGGNDWESSQAIKHTDDGGYIVSAATSSFGSGNGEIWILKLNSTGGVEWQKAYGDDGGNSVNSVIQISDGSYIFGGTIEPLGENWRMWLLKLQSDGDIEWQKEYSEWGFLNSIHKTSDNGILLAGGLDGAVWAAKANSDGNIIWEKGYDGLDLQSIAETPDGGVVLIGENNEFEFGKEIWVFKADSAGNLENCVQDIVEETSVSVGATSVSAVDTEGIVRDISRTYEDLDIDLEDAFPESSTQCGLNADDSLRLFEMTNVLSDGFVYQGESIRAVAGTADTSVDQVEFRWFSPSDNLVREVTTPISSPEDTFAPEGETGLWLVEADFGNGKVLRKEFNLSFFVVPESPIGAIAMVIAAMGSLGAFVYFRMARRSMTDI